MTVWLFIIQWQVRGGLRRDSSGGRQVSSRRRHRSRTRHRDAQWQIPMVDILRFTVGREVNRHLMNTKD